MKNASLKLIAPLLSVLLLCLVAANFLTARAQQPPPRPEPDPLMPLKHALEDAGAPALTSQQEDQLKTLVKNLRDARRSQAPDDALRTAHRAYDQAILAGNAAAAQAQATTIANQIAAHTSAHLQAEATFKINVLNILKTNDNQVGLLQQRFGTAGLSHLLGALAGGEGGPGPGGPGGPEGGPGSGHGPAGGPPPRAPRP